MNLPTPEIVADFEYDGKEFLVVYWPETEGEPDEFQIYRADWPWAWRYEAVDRR